MLTTEISRIVIWNSNRHRYVFK